MAHVENGKVIFSETEKRQQELRAALHYISAWALERIDEYDNPAEPREEVTDHYNKAYDLLYNLIDEVK